MHNLVCLDGATLYPAGSKEWNIFNFPGVKLKVFDRSTPGQVVERLKGASMALTNKVPIDAVAMAALPHLKYIGVLATGYNIVDVKAAADAGIVVTNIPAYSTASVAQQAISLLLAITNKVESYAKAVKVGAWEACPDFSFRIEPWHELADKSFGVVGFGNTGRATAAIAAALGMKILVFTSKSQEQLPQGYVKTELDDLFRQADVLSLHCPLTSDTHHLVDERRLSLMKPSAIVINTSRGPVVDERALANAMKNGTIRAAGLDVLSTEPPAHGNPLISAPRCFITPHVAWSSVEACSRLMKIAADNILAFLNGSPVNIV